ncbi:MAG TPA: hypothetical protein VHX19_12715 [Stellaceae bacterium]|nr:hypothetical protein [Stellaceae bacterium]
MQIAPTVAIIEVMPIVRPIPVLREPKETPRQRSKDWAALSTVGRGQLIDLVV